MSCPSPDLRRNGALQRTPTLASLLCELRAQRPDLVAEWSDGEVGLVLAPIFVGAPEVVAAEFLDKVLARRDSSGVGVRLYSPFLGRDIIASEADVALASAPRSVKLVPKKPRKTTRAVTKKKKKRAPKAQRAEAA